MSLEKPEWNLYQKEANPEHDLFKEYVMEFNDISGVPVYYYLSDVDIQDKVYGEDTITGYNGPKITKMIYEVGEETPMIDVFGIHTEDVIDALQIPIGTFKRDISSTIKPKPGDLIKTIWNDRIYEITSVNKETSIFQLKKFVYNFICKPWRYSEDSDAADNITLTKPVSAYGENEYIEEQSDIIDDYDDVETEFYGY